MKDLRLPMNELKFDELVTLGRSVIPTLAPAWTDHNAHDPGIMLIELLAWIAEAQMYSMSRTRQDERRAYARLLGVEALGPQAACGLIWPFAGNGVKNAPPMSWNAGRVLKPATPVTCDRPEAPTFYTVGNIQLTTAQLVRVETHFANGLSRDWTRANTQENATFMPFGDAPVLGDRLVLTFELDPRESDIDDTPVSLGIEVVNEVPKIAVSEPGLHRLRMSLTDARGERRLELLKDTTSGLLKSGVLLLLIGRVEPIADPNGASSKAKPTFTLTLRSVTGGFARPPRVRQIGINVIPIWERRAVTDNPREPFGKAFPGQQYRLEKEGLVYPTTDSTTEDSTVKVMLAENGNFITWTRTDDLGFSGPEDRHYELDIAKRTLTFGNGVNGKLAPQGAAIQVSYHVSSGARGNLPKGVRWNVEGLAGDFGVNREATTGGQDAQDLEALRAVARTRSRTMRPLITTMDLEQAARSFVDLGVTRAVELASDVGCMRPRGSRVLIVVGPHDDDGIAETTSAVEAPEFLEAVRSRLVPQLPLGQRLEVVGPQYVLLRITATLVARRKTDPKAVQISVVRELESRLAIVAANGVRPWPFGRDITQTTVKGWLRKVEGVARVVKVDLFAGTHTESLSYVPLRRMALPSLRVEAQDITVDRPPEGSAG